MELCVTVRRNYLVHGITYFHHVCYVKRMSIYTSAVVWDTTSFHIEKSYFWSIFKDGNYIFSMKTKYV